MLQHLFLKQNSQQVSCKPKHINLTGHMQQEVQYLDHEGLAGSGLQVLCWAQ